MSPSASTPSMPKGLGRSLRNRLGAVRRKLVRVEVIRRFAIALSVAVVGLALFLAADWVLDLPLDSRMGILVVLGTLVGLLVLRALVALFTQRRDEESLALMVEHEEPGFRSRLIATVQFARGKATVPDEDARALVERMVEDTEDFAKPLSLAGVVNTRPLKRALLVLVLLGGLGAAGYFAGGAITADLLKRAFLSEVPVPRATRVVWTSGDLKIGIGDTVTIEARAEDHLPKSGTLKLRFASGRKLNVRMEPRDEEPDLFAATIENVQESFTYRAAIHDGRSERQNVRALPRPTVVAVVGEQRYPDYTNLPPSTHEPGEFLVFPGSELSLEITASQPLKAGSVRLLGAEEITPLVVVGGEDNRVLRARFGAHNENLSGFTVELLDAEDMRSQDATVYRIDILKDEAPRVRIVKPSRQRELVTPNARPLVGYEAEDRFGIERVVLAYEVGEEGAETKRFELPLAEKGARNVAERYDWELETLSPAPQVGDEIRFWIEASDQNEETTAGKSTPRILKVVTAREKRDDLLSRVGDSLGRIDQATDDQERLNAVLADWIRSQASLPAPAPVPQPEPTPQPETDNED